VAEEEDRKHDDRSLVDLYERLIMPCGTGKTLVQLWAAERPSPKTVLVLAPSLALLSQTLGEWSHHTSWGHRFEYLCVCSDPTVSTEQDAIVIRSTDVPFHVDTDPAIVRRFLNRPAKGGVRVVFSTYQSAPVVARGVRGLSPFDLGIFDEAHKTTGLPGGTFAFALDDARLRIRKRLFFTATPRHIDIRRRGREGDFRVVSMDDPAIYGPLDAFWEQRVQDLVRFKEQEGHCRVITSYVENPQLPTDLAQQPTRRTEGAQALARASRATNRAWCRLGTE
jgi:predicted helicase